jgi:hypothetical protein
VWRVTDDLFQSYDFVLAEKVKSGVLLGNLKFAFGNEVDAVWG